MNKFIRLFNAIIITNLKLIILKIFNFSKFNFHPLHLISPFATIDLQNKGKLKLGKMCKILSSSTIGVRENGELKIENGVFINHNSQIICHKRITIDKDSCIGPNVIIVDHDHLYDKNGVSKKKFKSDDIYIGKNVWIGANCIILKGTVIGDNSVVGAGVILSGKYKPNSKIIQKRETTVVEID